MNFMHEIVLCFQKQYPKKASADDYEYDIWGNERILDLLILISIVNDLEEQKERLLKQKEQEE